MPVNVFSVLRARLGVPWACGTPKVMKPIVGQAGSLRSIGNRPAELARPNAPHKRLQRLRHDTKPYLRNRVLSKSLVMRPRTRRIP
jgi:hypothetical protein